MNQPRPERQPLGSLVGRGLTGANPQYVDADRKARPDSDEQDPNEQLPNEDALDRFLAHSDDQ